MSDDIRVPCKRAVKRAADHLSNSLGIEDKDRCESAARYILKLGAQFAEVESILEVARDAVRPTVMREREAEDAANISLEGTSKLACPCCEWVGQLYFNTYGQLECGKCEAAYKLANIDDVAVPPAAQQGDSAKLYDIASGAVCEARNEWSEKHEENWLEDSDQNMHPDEFIGRAVVDALKAANWIEQHATQPAMKAAIEAADKARLDTQTAQPDSAQKR